MKRTAKARSVIVILGPTAAGKSRLGIRLAKRFQGVVVSADSRQVYRGLPLCFGTATKKEMHGVPHYLLQFVSLKKQYTAGDYARAFQRLLTRLPASTPIFLVGGSPFYIEAALNPNRLAATAPNRRLRRQLEKSTTVQLVRELKKFNPSRAAAIDVHNRRRLIRAIEVAMARLSSLPPPPFPSGPYPLRILKLGLSLPRPALYQRIDERVDTRLAAGMLQEVARAHQRGVAWSRLESLGLEPRYLSRILRHTIRETVGVQQLKFAIHGFARRQLTWWRRDHHIDWIRSVRQAAHLTIAFLKKKPLAGRGENERLAS